MAKRLSKKEKGFAKDIVRGKTQVQAALDNYDTTDYNTAAVIATENLNKPKIQAEIKRLADRIPDDLLEQVHLEGLMATKLSGTGGMTIGIGKDGVESMGHSDLEVPDYATRHKYLDSAYKLKGAYAPDKSINLNMEVKADDPLIQKIAAVVNERMKDDLQGIEKA